MTLTERVTQYEKLMRLDKPIGILLLLWPTLWGLWFAGRGHPNWRVVWIFLLGTVLMRSAGCVINDVADRNFDAHVERTRNRPLATGSVSVREALALAALLALAAFLLILPLNSLVIWLSLPALAIAIVYPFTKRFFSLPQAVLGVAFAFGIPMAFAALVNRVPPLAWWLFAASFFWTIAYDTEYAMVDREDDLRIGIRTSAVTFGRFDVAAVMLCYALSLGILAGVGRRLGMGWPYWAGLAGAAAIAAYHGWLIHGRDRQQCFRAFLHNNWLGAAVFVGIAADFLLRRGWS